MAGVKLTRRGANDLSEMVKDYKRRQRRDVMNMRRIGESKGVGKKLVMLHDDCKVFSPTVATILKPVGNDIDKVFLVQCKEGSQITITMDDLTSGTIGYLSSDTSSQVQTKIDTNVGPNTAVSIVVGEQLFLFGEIKSVSPNSGHATRVSFQPVDDTESSEIEVNAVGTEFGNFGNAGDVVAIEYYHYFGWCIAHEANAGVRIAVTEEDISARNSGGRDYDPTDGSGTLIVAGGGYCFAVSEQGLSSDGDVVPTGERMHVRHPFGRDLAKGTVVIIKQCPYSFHWIIIGADCDAEFPSELVDDISQRIQDGTLVTEGA